jgi:hypothetical protein
VIKGDFRYYYVVVKELIKALNPMEFKILSIFLLVII